MELVKQTEQYRLNDMMGEWSVSGNVYNNVNGSISINGVVTFGSEAIGNFNYSKPVEGNVTFNCETSENNREVFSNQASTLITKILTNLK
jgi:hypothetical protein